LLRIIGTGVGAGVLGIRVGVGIGEESGVFLVCESLLARKAARKMAAKRRTAGIRKRNLLICFLLGLLFVLIIEATGFAGSLVNWGGTCWTVCEPIGGGA